MKWSEIITKCDKKISRTDKITKSDLQWKEDLVDELTYSVTREKGTERPYSNDMCERFETGVYACRCCGEKLFDSTSKFNSGTGWPSFDKPINNNAINYFKDTTKYRNHTIYEILNMVHVYNGLDFFPQTPACTTHR